MSDQSGNCTGQHQKCSENVRCPTVISCSDVATLLFMKWEPYCDYVNVMTKMSIARRSLVVSVHASTRSAPSISPSDIMQVLVILYISQ